MAMSLLGLGEWSFISLMHMDIGILNQIKWNENEFFQKWYYYNRGYKFVRPNFYRGKIIIWLVTSYLRYLLLKKIDLRNENPWLIRLRRSANDFLLEVENWNHSMYKRTCYWLIADRCMNVWSHFLSSVMKYACIKSHTITFLSVDSNSILQMQKESFIKHLL